MRAMLKVLVSFLSSWTPIYNDFRLLPRQSESTPAIRGHFQQYPDEGTTQAAASQQPSVAFDLLLSWIGYGAKGIFSTKDL
ncbi:unnamed protein product [Lasius platythorax]|uniref:Uncharacterized protein n=1 Tax=Lasius platythorax TaxID=488582 RepID=A0AAV2P6F4_9HYME